MPLAPVLLSLLVAVASAAPPGARIVAEWDPGVSATELGGELVVDGYGVDGLGAYQVRLADGSSVLAVCIQAHLGHSLGADYAVDGSVSMSAELGYLAWAHLRPGARPTDEQAAALNALAWRYTGARRRTGGPVWHGDEVDVRVLGRGRLTAVEGAIAALHAEASARRGPWALTAPTVADGVAGVRLAGPGGPIGGIVVRFDGDAGWSSAAVTDVSGVATAAVPDGIAVARAVADGPGDAIALAAPGSQRLALAGPSVPVTASFPAPATTTTSSSTSTSTASTSTSTTTTGPVVTSTSTAPPTFVTATTPSSAIPTTTSPTTSELVATTTSTPAPVVASTTTTATTIAPAAVASSTTTSAVARPPLPTTGSGGRRISRWAALAVACGAFAVLAATPRRGINRG